MREALLSVVEIAAHASTQSAADRAAFATLADRTHSSAEPMRIRSVLRLPSPPRRVCAGLLIGALAMASPAAKSADVEVARVADRVFVRHPNGSSDGLQLHAPLQTGDTVASGPDGRISFRLAGGGSFVLGGGAALVLDGTEPPDPPGRSTLAKLRLGNGSLHVDARKPEQGGAPADVRLNLRYLQARLYGTDAWAETSAAGDELCVVSGAAEIETPGTHQRLDTPGSCLRWTASGMQKLDAAQAGNLLPRLAATSFTDDYATRYAGEQAIKAGEARPTLAQTAAGLTIAVAPAPATVASNAAPAAPSEAETTIHVIETATPIAAPEGTPPAVADTGSTNPDMSAPEATAAAGTAVAAETPTETTAPPPPAEPIPVAAAPVSSGPRVWRILLGTYIDRPNAARASAQWQRHSLSTDIEAAQVDDRAVFNVLCGRYESRAQADAALTHLRTQAGYENALVLSVPDTRVAQAPAMASAARASPPAASARPIKAAAATRQTWRISLGSFVDQANAERTVAKWKTRNLQTDIEPIRLKGRDAYRVLCGHYDDRADADAALRRLRANPGYEHARVLAVPDSLSKR